MAKKKIRSALGQPSNTFLLAVVIVFSGLLFLLWSDWPARSVRLFPDLDGATASERGQFGDSFGVLNTLFTGLAFMGLLITLVFQLRESGMRRVSEIEARVFHLNDTLRQVIASMSAIEGQGTSHTTKHDGKNVFPVYVELVKNGSLEDAIATVALGAGLDPWIDRYLAAFRHGLDNHLAPYFRVFYRLMHYIDSADVPKHTKIELAEIVRAELSPAEVQLLALNCLTEYGANFKPLVEKYHLLKHIPDDDRLLAKESFMRRFDLSAFLDDDDPRPEPPTPAAATQP